ncbi:cell division protein [Lysinibacillus sphaericus]|uniref:Cell division protein n=1 Tax=Lysinibacillus sphaericus TaxID=1421 RepID=A0A2S0JXI9_LYSSH|nr:cell division FtsA domain-containing protein [Lysinibacillus sphaericus]AVK95860.1 cell division protein [Lysinibacillus sphaericus]MED4544936.1 cell division FtsA domain-containing protein [Lysinibacillus sphaericus]TKI21596.1 cell division protein [Lysinibacillus sphaericus]SUV18397.1 cell division protein [Lysinibacillus sphaericus]GEC80583.1 cell division protein FtsA [Lysinibacillus sphaericus]
MSSKLFALDIGTRSVVGIILEEDNDHFHVQDILVKEHKERAMVDGQIHNVMYVAELINEIKQELEEKHGPLSKVSVAAAGRSLKTEQASVTINIRNRPIFTEEDISRLELQAVQQAQQRLLQHKEDTKTSHYYCVGYSVLYYRLDGEEIGSLLDQQGDEAQIEVIATFLPRVVVESLIAALKRANLEMDALTLEPIAAINVLIPPTMRRLNVALVDIGAGTSDIAITDKSTVVAYGMVPTAGDEITEALSDHYLLDFPVAEEAKRQLHCSEEILIQDILGFDQYYPKEEVLSAIEPAVKQLAKAIGEEILRLNNRTAPKAVMLVGGGSLTPNLTTEIGLVLDLPANRIAVRGVDAIQNLTKEAHIKASPELVTPIGIAIAAKKMPIQYMSLTVNEQIVRLFELKEMTVGDAFLAANIRAKQLYGKPGHGLSISVNGQDIFIPGGHGQPAQILVNGQQSSTKTIIKTGDAIQLIEGQDGLPATATIRDIVDQAVIKTITIQETKYVIEPKITVNGSSVSMDALVNDRDIIAYEIAETVEDVFTLTNNTNLLKQFESYVIYVDGKPLYLPAFSANLLINGKPGKLSYAVQHNDIITFSQPSLPTVQRIADHMNVLLEDKIIVHFQQELLELKKTTNEVLVNQAVVSPLSTVPNGATVSIQEKDRSPWIYQDVFRFSNWQLPTTFKGNFTILRNGQPATFDTEIFGGDQLEIVLEEAPLSL